MPKFIKLKGANIDIDLTTESDKISWKQDECPWNKDENSKAHKCAVKNVSICDYFRGIAPVDYVLCAHKIKKKK